MKRKRESEKELLASYEKGEWRSIKTPAMVSRYREYARATLVKDKRVNIRLSSRDLKDIQVRAAEEGMPYQTLMASVLHKYLTGRLLEPKRHPTGRSSRASRKRAAA